MDGKTNWERVPKIHARDYYGPVYWDGHGFSDSSELAFALRLIGKPLPERGVWAAKERFIDLDRDAILKTLKADPAAPSDYEPSELDFITDFINFYNEELADRVFVPDYTLGIVFGPERITHE